MSELDVMELWATDIGNAYLDVVTREKLYIRAGPEFGKWKDTFLLPTKHCMDYVSAGSYSDKSYKNVFKILDSNLFLLSLPSIQQRTHQLVIMST